MNRLLLVALALPLLAGPAAARPAYRKALVELLELPSSSRLNDCRTCHLAPKPGPDDKDRPHTPPPAARPPLKAARAALKKAGKPTDLSAPILHVAAEDSDKDGVANLHELLAGTFPGDPADKPDADAVASARKRQVALLDSLKRY